MNFFCDFKQPQIFDCYCWLRNMSATSARPIFMQTLIGLGIKLQPVHKKLFTPIKNMFENRFLWSNCKLLTEPSINGSCRFLIIFSVISYAIDNNKGEEIFIGGRGMPRRHFIRSKVIVSLFKKHFDAVALKEK